MFSTSLPSTDFSNYFRGTMGMPLRITFRDRDYSFQVVNEEPITRDTTEIPIILNGGELLDIAVLDHLIITADSYYSFADEGLL